nr:hypothetical protein [Desulfobacula sp.]
MDNGIEQVLFEIVSRLTGFPSEMLEPDMDIESDLGIDSIKKVEIISELEKQIPDGEGITTESMGSVRTLQDICRAIHFQPGSATRPLLTSPAHQKTELSEISEKGYDHTVSAVLMSTISELTGFPVEMLEPGMNLESDLGIDSIKRVEILSRLEQALDSAEGFSSDDMGRLKTIREIIDFLVKPQKNPEPAVEASSRPRPELPPEPDSIHAGARPARKVVSLKKYPTNEIRFYNGARIELPKGKKVYITRDGSHISEQFQREFERIGIPCVLIDLGNGEIPELPDAAGIVIVPDAFHADPALSGMDF